MDLGIVRSHYNLDRPFSSKPTADRDDIESELKRALIFEKQETNQTDSSTGK